MSGETSVGAIVGYLRLDDSDWDATLDRAGAKADELGRHDPRITINVNSSDAMIQLTQVAAAEKAVDEGNRRIATSGRQAGGGMGVLATAIITLGPALVPVTGAALGLGSAFAGMGIAGVLAIGGIKKEMAAGTSLGKVYTSQIHGLQDDLTILQRTAANGVLGPFRAVVADINTRMPTLNTEVGRFSSALGATAVPAVKALFDGWEALQPLLAKGSVALVQIAQGADDFARSKGFHDFLSYAAAELPNVLQLLGSLLTTVGHIVVAFEPIGSTVVMVVTDLSGAINAIPLPVLSTLATLGVGAVVAFKGWGAISSAVESVQTTLGKVGPKAAAAGIGLGTLSLAAAGIGVVIAAAAYAWNKHEQAVQDNKKAIDDYTQALIASNGVVDENIRKMTAKALIDSGAAKTAAALGTSLQDLTTAALDPTSQAWTRLHAAMTASDSVSTSVTAHLAGQSDVFGQQAPLVHAVTDAHAQLNTVMQGTSDQLAEAKKQWAEQQAINAAAIIVTDSNAAAQQTLAARLGTTVDALSKAQLAQKSQSDAAAAATLVMQNENDAAGLLKGSLDALNGKALSAADAQNAFDSSLANMGDHVTATGKKIHFTTTSIHDMSAASVALRGQLNSQVHNLEAVAEAHGGLANMTGKSRAEMVKLRKQIIDNAVAHGVDRKAVTDYIDSIFKIPKSVPPTKLDIDDKAAKAAIAEITKARTVWLTLKVANTQGANQQAALYDRTHQAYGGIQHFAAGGMLDGPLPRSATIARDGANLINWAEPGTGDEAFIPLSPSRRATSVPVLEEANRRMGNPLGAGKGLTDADFQRLARMIGDRVEAGAARGTSSGMGGLNGRLGAML